MILEALADLDNEAVVERLVALRGIGRWTAEYVLLRGLGRLTMFPGADVGARTKPRPLDEAADAARLRARTGARASLAAVPRFLDFHLLLQSLDEADELAVASAMTWP